MALFAPCSAHSQLTTKHLLSVISFTNLSANNADTGFSVITTQHNIVIMDYTLESTNGVRVGQLKFATDTSASTSTIDDIFTETGTVGIVFNLNIATPNIMKLQYTDSDNLISNFKYTYQSWNSS